MVLAGNAFHNGNIDICARAREIPNHTRHFSEDRERTEMEAAVDVDVRDEDVPQPLHKYR